MGFPGSLSLSHSDTDQINLNFSKVAFVPFDPSLQILYSMQFDDEEKLTRHWCSAKCDLTGKDYEGICILKYKL